MNVHVGTDAGNGYVITITGTSANMHDVSETANLIREEANVVYMVIPDILESPPRN